MYTFLPLLFFTFKCFYDNGWSICFNLNENVMNISTLTNERVSKQAENRVDKMFYFQAIFLLWIQRHI